MYKDLSYSERDYLINKFIELYLQLTISDYVYIKHELTFKADALQYSLIMACECDDIKVSARDTFDIKADAKEITNLIDILLNSLREEYGKQVSKKLIRRRD